MNETAVTDKPHNQTMAGKGPKNIASQFNDFINGRDLDGLEALMSDDHTFIDMGDSKIEGKRNCLAAWREFFRLFPDYKNIFEKTALTDGKVVIAGYSTCSEPQLDGPALWTAKVKDGKVAEWRVYEDSAEIRQQLGIA